MAWTIYLAVFVSLAGYLIFQYKQKNSKQLAYIKEYRFHKSIKDKIYKKYPHLTDEQTHLVFRALRDYFWMCNMGNRKMVAMPSKVVDDAWHEFILFTRSYKMFCKKALGRFLHHTPTEAMRAPTVAQEGIKRAWRLACSRAYINPKNPQKLPLIFAIDSMLNIPDGFTYNLNCEDKNTSGNNDGFCAGHIGCSSDCAGDSGSTFESETASESSGFFDFLDCGGDCGGGCGGD